MSLYKHSFPLLYNLIKYHLCIKKLTSIIAATGLLHDKQFPLHTSAGL